MRSDAARPGRGRPACTGVACVRRRSNEVFDTSVYAEYLRPSSVPCWLRSMASNMLAPDGRGWAALFAAFASGTYNNQWQVIDAQKFTPAAGGTPAGRNGGAQPGLLWLVEEAPGLVHAGIYSLAGHLAPGAVGRAYWLPIVLKVFRSGGGPTGAQGTLGDQPLQFTLG